MHRTRCVMSGALVLLAACAGDGTGPGNDTGGGATFAADVQPILTANCALSGCHAGTSPQQGMNLAAGQAYLNIVSVQSMEVPSLFRVAPGQPDSSYLVHKIQGTQASVGGGGSQMPLGGAPLSQEQIDTIRAWISDGAKNN